MLNEFPGFEDVDVAQWLPYAGLVLGLILGAVLQSSRFCLRRGILEWQSGGRSAMAGSFVIALLVAAAGTQALIANGWLSLEETRFVQNSLALGPVLLGGLFMGSGMVLTRGCPSRLTTLSAQGNLRAALVILVFAVTAHASLRGVLAEPRQLLGDVSTIELAEGSFPLWALALLGVAGVFIVWRSGVGVRLGLAGVLIGAVIVLGWFATGTFLQDSFDPRPADSLAFTAGASDTLFYVIASTALEPGFAVGVFAGVLAGAFASALLRREVKIESFESAPQTLRYLLGAFLMGLGGVWAGGCTIGAGLTATSALSVSGFLALGAMIIGALLTNALLNRPQEGGALSAAV